MELTIDKQDFLAAIGTPSAQGDDLYNRCKPLFEPAKEQLEKLYNYAIADYPNNNLIVKSAAVAFVCLTAYYNAIPSIDLVWSSTGFGIVQNNTLAPASRERVDALRQNVLAEATAQRYRLLAELFTIRDFAVRQSQMGFVCLYSQYQRTAGERLSVVDFENQLPKMRRAERRLQRLISEAELDNLRELAHLQWTADYAASAVQNEVIELITSFAIETANGLCTADSYLPDILAIVNDEQNADDFPAYVNSSEYEANNSANYENTLDKPTYFFV